MQRRTPARTSTAPSLAGSVIVLCLALLLAGCAARPPAALVASPPSDARPGQVTQAFVDALNARDADLVHALTTTQFADHLGKTWLKGGYLTKAVIGETIEDVGEYSGPAGDVGADPATVGVRLTFVPEQCDQSVTNGSKLEWTVLLVLQEGKWLVYDWGVL